MMKSVDVEKWRWTYTCIKWWWFVLIYAMLSHMFMHIWLSPVLMISVDGGSIRKITPTSKTVPHSCRVVSRALHAYEGCELYARI